MICRISLGVKGWGWGGGLILSGTGDSGLKY